MTAGGDLGAAMTFAGGSARWRPWATEFEPALPDLYRAGVAQEMADLAALGREVPPQHTGTFAVVGATLVDAAGTPPIPDAVVIVRDARIVAAGQFSERPRPFHPGVARDRGEGPDAAAGLVGNAHACVRGGIRPRAARRRGDDRARLRRRDGLSRRGPRRGGATARGRSPLAARRIDRRRRRPGVRPRHGGDP